MRILWITNIVFPEAVAIIKGTSKELSDTGGWLISSASMLIRNTDVQLAVASVSGGVTDLQEVRSSSGVFYYIIPYGKGNLRPNSEYDKYWSRILAKFKPDIIHIHGTEFSHGLSCINVSQSVPVVVSIQGVVREIAKNYLGGLNNMQILKSLTIYDLTHQTLWEQKRTMLRQANVEEEMLSKVKYVIGRTSFDYKAVTSINPRIKYYHCNESLRDVFYEEPYWEYSNCKPHSIFYSQSRYPLKGLHVLLRALPKIRELFPDVSVRVASDSMINKKTIRSLLRQTGYSRHLESLVHKYKLENVIEFTGHLDDKGMKNEYLHSNVFVCASSNENSSNSIGEAQLLGVPVVASAVGGNMDIVNNTNMGLLFAFDDEDELAQCICDQFNTPCTINNTEMRTQARKRHDRNNNNIQLQNIYKDLILQQVV